MRNFDVVLFGDGVLSPIGAILKLFFRNKKFICIIHGLDITYAYKKSLLGKIYNSINIPAQKKFSRLIMVGHETISEAVKIGIPENICVFIPNGIEVDEICANFSRQDLENLIGLNLDNKKIIFRGGRFVKHKGVEWFIRNVVPRLPDDYVFVAAGPAVSKKTAGDESDYDSAERAIKELNLENQVILLTKLSRRDIKILFNTCDLYVSPNIKVAGSMEGFGITAIEAGACGRVVLASDLEGLKDAIQNGQNGFLIESGNASAYAVKIKDLMENDGYRIEFGKKARKYVVENYSWEIIARRYLEEIKKVISN
jgi:glycosyltransferase involved in cell wall biosynthesis